MNLDYEVIPALTQDNIFSAASRMGIKTASSGYYWFEKLIPADDLDAGFFTPGEDEAADLDVMAAALPWLDDPGYGLVLIHIDQYDHIAHVNGALSPEAEQAARNADTYLGEILEKLDLSQDTILICSDHGHIDQGGHGGPESIVSQEPLVMAGAGIKSGKYDDVKQVDIAPTIAALLGSNLPATAQGHALTDMMLLTGSQLGAISDAEKAQQTTLADAFDAALGVTVARNSEGIPQAGAFETVIRERLQAEQLPRLLTTIAILIAVVALIIRFNQQPLVPVLGSAAVFLVVFNGIYALVLGNHYSFSSIKSIMHLVVSYALIALISVAIALIVLRFWSKTSPRQGLRFSQVSLSFRADITIAALLARHGILRAGGEDHHLGIAPYHHPVLEPAQPVANRPGRRVGAGIAGGGSVVGQGCETPCEVRRCEGLKEFNQKPKLVLVNLPAQAVCLTCSFPPIFPQNENISLYYDILNTRSHLHLSM